MTTLVDALPTLHDLKSMENVRKNILETAATIIPCRGVMLTMENCDFASVGEEVQGFRFTSTTFGEVDDLLSDKNVEQLIFRVRGENSILLGKKVVLPLMGDIGWLMGILILEPSEGIAYDQLQLLEVFSRQAASVLRNVMLYTEVQDPYTRGHFDRVSFYACQIAHCMGRDEDYCEHVRIAGLFHDMGKISIPDEVLLKPSRLTDKEFDIIKSHSASGMELLSAVSQFRGILGAVRGQHA